MFDTRTTGKKIAALRKGKNMTQMELADEMGVSYQAVSNWERGNSMPDISKLPQLALILGCSVDEILGESEATELVEHIIKGTEKEYIEETDAGVDVITHVAPIVKPEQTKEMVQTVIEKTKSENEKQEKKISVKALVGIAPFLDEEYLEHVIEEAEIGGKMKEIVGLAPFLSDKALDKLIDRAIREGNVDGCKGLCPFLSKEALHKLAEYMMKQGDSDGLKSIMPFV